MLVYTYKVFAGGLSGTTAVYSKASLNRALAQADKFYVTARATNASGTATLNVTLQHSNHDSSGEFKDIGNVISKLLNPNTTQIEDGTLVPGVVGGFVRAEIKLTGTNPNAYVEVWITGRVD